MVLGLFFVGFVGVIVGVVDVVLGLFFIVFIIVIEAGVGIVVLVVIFFGVYFPRPLVRIP